MDPQKLPDANGPTSTNNPPRPSDATNDNSMSEESSVLPGTVVVGGQTPPDADVPSPADADVPSPSNDPVSTSDVPTPDEVGADSPVPSTDSEPQMAAFMRGDAPVDTPPAPTKKKTGLIVGIIAAVLLLVGGGAAAYFAFMKPNPDKILQQALVNTFSKDKVTSVAFDGGVVVTDPESSMDVSFDFSGAASQTQFEVAATLAIPSLTSMTLDMASADGENFYLKVGGLESILPILGLDATTANYVPLLQTIDDQWYSISQETLSQFAGETVPTSTSGLSDADRQKLADAYQQNAFLTVVETLKDEKVAGVDSYHYKVQVDSAKLKSFLTAIESAGLDMSSTGLTKPVIESFKNNIDNTNLSSTPVDIWIAKDSKLFTQFTFTTMVDDVEMDVNLMLMDYNKPVEVEVPADAKPVTELLVPFLTLMQ